MAEEGYEREVAEQSTQENNAAWENTSQEITADSLKDFFIKNLSKIDSSKNGAVTEKELKNALASGNFAGKDKEMLETIYNNYSTLSKINARKGGGEPLHLSPQINPRDMMVYAALNKVLKTEQNEMLAGVKFAKDNFATLDKDGNGYISMPELWSSAHATRPEVAALARHAHRIKTASNDEWFFERKGLSKNDLEKYPDKWKKENDHMTDGLCGCAMCRLGRPTKGAILGVADK